MHKAIAYLILVLRNAAVVNAAVGGAICLHAAVKNAAIALLLLRLLLILHRPGALLWTRWLFSFRYWPFGPAHQDEAACFVMACLVLAVLLLIGLRRPLAPPASVTSRDAEER